MEEKLGKKHLIIILIIAVISVSAFFFFMPKTMTTTDCRGTHCKCFGFKGKFVCYGITYSCVEEDRCLTIGPIF